MQKTRYLVQRESGFYARIVVPVALRQLVGKRELSTPLRATSKAEALRKLPAAVAEMQAQIDVARAEAKAVRTKAAPARKGQVLTPRQLAVDHYETQMRFDEELRNSDPRFAHGYAPDDYVRGLREAVSGALSNEDMKALIPTVIANYESRGNLAAEFGTSEWREAARALAIAELESLARTAERDDGDFNGTPSHPLLTAQPEPVAPNDPQAARILGPDSTKPLSEIVPLFLKERGASPQTEYESRRTAQMFEEYLEEAKPIYTVTRSDVRGFKQALSELPVNYTKRFPKMTLPQAIKANSKRSEPFPALDPRTINEKYLSKLHSILNWCVRNDIIPDNPAANIKVDVVKDKRQPPRVNFSPGDLGKIFSPDRYDANKPFTEQQWAELCALFTGARASELAQVKLDSIRHERGLLVMAIEEQTKNLGSQRLIPIHSTLLGLGFETHVKNLREQGATHLFPEWYRKGAESFAKSRSNGKVTLNHHFPKYIPKQFNVTTRKKVGINDSRKIFHSFRHTFKTGLARAGVDRSMQDSLCGHADHSAGAGYVHGAAVEAMKAAIEKLRYDGFGLKRENGSAIHA